MIPGIKDRKILLIVILALLVRLAFVLFYPQMPLLEDPAGYDRMSWELATGKGLPVVKVIDEVIISRPPGYPVFLATVYLLFGHNYQPVRVVQAALDSLTCLVIFCIGAQLFNISVGYAAALCYSLYFIPVAYTGMLYPESIYTLILGVSMLLLILAVKNDRLKYWLGAGIFLGLSALISSRSMYLPLFIFLGFFWKTRSFKLTVKRAGIVLLCMLVLFSPWTMRNYMATKKFILLESYGQNMAGLWLATNPYGAMDWDMTKEPLKSKYGSLTKEERIRVFRQEAWSNLRQYPGAYLKNSAKRFFILWVSSHGNRISGLEKSFSASWKNKERGVVLLKLLLLSVNTVFVILGFLGMWFERRKWKESFFVIMSPALYFSLIATFYVTGPRLQVPVIPYMMIFAVAGALRCLGFKKSRL